MTEKSISKVIIAGSRNFEDYEKLVAVCDKVLYEVASRPVTIFRRDRNRPSRRAVRP